MTKDHDPRAEELYNLRLALATFALQLDVFEARLKNRSSEKTIITSLPAATKATLANNIVSAMKSGNKKQPD
jgi:hypothetical protein